MAEEFYNGTKLMSLKDKNSMKPEIYISTSRRNRGKTTFYNKMVVNKFLKKKIRKFGLIYRYGNEIENISSKFFKDINKIFFPGYYMEDKVGVKNKYSELFLNGKNCGYAFALNAADSIKKISHLFSDVDIMIFDEFQPETNKYVSDEVTKFLSLHTSIARGNGEQIRYVPVIFIGNLITLLNPYYTALNISQNLSENTKYLRGDGFVLEQDSATISNLMESGVRRAFSKHIYINSQSGEVLYLNDNKSLIGKYRGQGKYLASLYCGNEKYSLKLCYETNMVYCCKSFDSSFPIKIAVSNDDINFNIVSMRQYSLLKSLLRRYYDMGRFRFETIDCKELVFKMLSY